MTTSLRARNLLKIFSLTLIMLVFVATKGFTQYVIDGNYDKDEYSSGQVIIMDSTATGTCEVGEIFAVVKDDVLLIGIQNGNAGNAIFRYYFDTDPDNGVDYEVFKGETIYVGGADRVLQIQANDASSLEVYEWNGSSWVPDGNGITAMVGDYTPGDKKFIEIMVSLGESTFYDICDHANNGEIRLATYASFSGGNIHSKPCYSEIVGFSINLKGIVTPETQEYCEGENTETLFTLSGDWGKILGWQSSLDSINWSDYILNTTDATEFLSPDNLTETTYYRAIIQSSVCDVIALESAVGKITIHPKETVEAVSDIDICDGENIDLEATYSGFASSVNWTGPNGFSSDLLNPAAFIAEPANEGEYVVTVTNETGCEVSDTLQIHVLSTTVSTENITACDSYLWNGTTYTTSGTYTFSTENAEGCDSTATLNLTINKPSVSTENITACDSYFWNGTTYTTSGTYTFSTENAEGCDSTATLNLTITKSSSRTENIIACGSYELNGEVYTQSGSYTQTIESETGCDLTVTLILTINKSSQETITANVCKEFTINNETYTESGVYVQHLTNVAGCDSTLTIDLTVEDSDAPVANCKDFTAQLDASGSFTLSVEDINNGSSDDCSIDTMYISKTDFTCADLGQNEITLTVVDANGNESTCTSTVTIEAGDSNCGQVDLIANPDELTLVVCRGYQFNGNINLLANDEGISSGNVSLSLENVPDNVNVNTSNGEVTLSGLVLNDDNIQFTYTICNNANTENCSSSLVTIHVFVDSDCDGVADIDDIDDDDDGILDVIEEDNALNQQTLDSDGDGIVDRLDIDSDNDGIVDNIEWQSTVAEGGDFEYFAPLGTDSDGDGWDDRYDDNGENIFYPAWDMDEDGTPDYLDLNTDDDEYNDANEGHDANFDNFADIQSSGIDSDHDGLDDAFDTYDTNSEWVQGKNAIGSNAPLQDENANGIRDWREQEVVIAPPIQAQGTLTIPDGFSPNSDNYNDYFEIGYIDNATGVVDKELFGNIYPNASIEIYNRWGNLIYTKENYGNTSKWGDYEAWWDGTSMNKMQLGSKKLPAGTYFYILNLDSNEVIKGSIFLNK